MNDFKVVQIGDVPGSPAYPFPEHQLRAVNGSYINAAEQTNDLLEKMEGIGQAIHKDKKITFLYTSSNGNRSFRTVRPTLLYFGTCKNTGTPQWLFKGHDESTGKTKVFMVDNIGEI